MSKTNPYLEARKAVIRDSLARSNDFASATTDAPEAFAFLVSQLAYTENKLFEKGRRPLQYAQLIPISYEAGEWAETIRYEMYDYAGQAKATSGRGKDINKVDVAYGQKTMNVVSGNIGYDYTTDELRKSMFLKRPLNERRAAAAMDAYERHLNQVGLNGEATHNITGLYNNANVPQVNAVNGASASPLWSSKTPDEILADINTGLNTVWANTAYGDMVTTVLIPATQYALITSKARSANSDKTILQFIKENNIAKTERGIELEFIPAFDLATAGVGATARIMFYVKRDDRLIMHIPMPIKFMAPQLNGLLYEVPGEYKYSGVEFRYPKSALYMDGV